MNKVCWTILVTLSLGTLMAHEDHEINNTKHSISISLGIASPMGELTGAEIDLAL